MTDTIDTPETTNTADLPASDRRALLRKIAIGGAGAAAGAVLLNNGRVSAGDDGAAGTGNTLELGEAESNTSVTPTTLVHTPADARTQARVH